MAELWHYAIDGQARDPVTFADIKRLTAEGILRPTDLVWHEGLPQWIRAGSVKEFFAPEAEAPRAILAEDEPSAAAKPPAAAVGEEFISGEIRERLPRARPTAARTGSARTGSTRPAAARPSAARPRRFAKPRRWPRYIDDDDFEWQAKRRRRTRRDLKTAVIATVLGTAVLALGAIAIFFDWASAVRPTPFRVQDRLTLNDSLDRVKGESRCKVYWVRLEKGSLYQIDMMTLEQANPQDFLTFDPFVRIEDSWRRQLGFDDDSGGWPNARLFFRPPHTGSYRIIATSFSKTPGRFALSVSRANGVHPFGRFMQRQQLFPQPFNAPNPPRVPPRKK